MTRISEECLLTPSQRLKDALAEHREAQERAIEAMNAQGVSLNDIGRASRQANEHLLALVREELEFMAGVLVAIRKNVENLSNSRG